MLGGPAMLIGLGGGSSMDCAKGINFLLTNGGDMEDYWGVNKAARPLLPSVGIPTTAGTGAEVTRNSVMLSPEHQVKVSMRSPLISLRRKS